jgi:hypothetical protein
MTHNKALERVFNYVGSVDERHEFALMYFVRRKQMQGHGKPLTAQQSDVMEKYRQAISEGMEQVAKAVQRGANELRKSDWEYR